MADLTVCIEYSSLEKICKYANNRNYGDYQQCQLDVDKAHYCDGTGNIE